MIIESTCKRWNPVDKIVRVWIFFACGNFYNYRWKYHERLLFSYERGLFQNIPVVHICFKILASFDETQEKM